MRIQMNYYIDYKKRYPKLDRIIHVFAHLLFVALVFVGAYIAEFALLIIAVPDMVAELWMNYSGYWMISVPMLVIPTIAAFIAFVNSNAYRRVCAPRISSAIFLSIGLFSVK